MRSIWIGVSVLALAFGAPAIAAPPQNGTGAYAARRYRNLFAEQLGVSPAAAHAKIDRAFQQLFHGDGQEERVYFETGANSNGTLAYITDWANNDVRTEGMSYGSCPRASRKRTERVHSARPLLPRTTTSAICPL